MSRSPVITSVNGYCCVVGMLFGGPRRDACRNSTGSPCPSWFSVLVAVSRLAVSVMPGLVPNTSEKSDMPWRS